MLRNNVVRRASGISSRYVGLCAVMLSPIAFSGIHGSGMRSTNESGTAGIHGSGMRGIHGSGMRSTEESGAAGIHGSGMRGIHGSGMRSADESGAAGIHGSGMRGIHGSGMRGIHGSGMRGIHGSGMRGIHGSGMRGIHGSGMRSAEESGGVGIHGSGMRGIHGSGMRSDAEGAESAVASAMSLDSMFALAALGPLEAVSVEGGTTSILVIGQAFEYEGSIDEAIETGDYVFAGSLDGQHLDILVPVGEAYVLGVSQVQIVGEIAEVDSAHAKLTVGSTTVDYSALLGADPDYSPVVGQAIEYWGNQTTVSGPVLLGIHGSGMR
jgi:hypothetical protein